MRLLGTIGQAAGAVFRHGSARILLTLSALIAGMVGTGLLAAAAISGMARVVGPILALALVGAVFLMAAAVLWPVGHARRQPPRPTQPPPDRDEAVSESEAAFAVGFALGRFLIRKLAG